MKYNDSFDPDINLFNPGNGEPYPCDYYNKKEFYAFRNILRKSDKTNFFSTLHLNIRSLQKSHDNLRQYLSALDHTFSVIPLSETWLSEDSAALHEMSQYNCPLL